MGCRIQPILRLTPNVRKIYAICNINFIDLDKLEHLSISNYYEQQQKLHYVPYNLITLSLITHV